MATVQTNLHVLHGDISDSDDETSNRVTVEYETLAKQLYSVPSQQDHGAGSGLSSIDAPTNGIAPAQNLSTITKEGILNALAQGTTQFVFETKRYGYSSGKQGTPLYFAISVMGGYFLIDFLYLLYLAVSCWCNRDFIPMIVTGDSMEIGP
ncbi:hypothetical protein QBC44DRAFT_368744 [Cladorrhinum sp. PSN332]|nr:hypothetical protein QBC44DRAFT_368744 [Cladorrhinum sp. PSN332]